MATTRKGALILLALAILLTACLPNSRHFDLSFVATPLVMLMYNARASVLYWVALFTGLTLDIIEMSPRLGFLGLAYLLSSWWLFPWRVYFFKDSKITLPVMTFLFSVGTSLAELLIALFFDLAISHPAPSWFFLNPLSNAAVSIVVFVLPSYFWQLYRERIRRRRCSDDT
jgi:hypothetical protein